MRGLIAVGLIVALGAGTARASTPGEVLCASYKTAVAKETDRAKRETMIRSAPHGCEVREAPVRRAAPEPVRQAAQPVPEAAPKPIPEAVPEATPTPPPPPPRPVAPLPRGLTLDQANKNGNKAYQTQDYAGAMRWFHMAADQGDAAAQNAIGAMYFFGRGVPVNYAEAMSWYRRSAAAGNAAAQDGIGALYARGQGVSVNYAEAVRWFRLSAAQGNSDAANWMGYFYTHGLSVARDVTQAQEWYAKSRADKVAGR